MKKVLLIVSSVNFQPLEYQKPKEILENNNIKVITASDAREQATSVIPDIIARVDILIDQVNVSDYDGVFVVGGPGALPSLDNEIVYKLLNEAKEQNKLLGAICISPRILANAGVLKDKKATGWNGDQKLDDILKKAGAQYVKQAVVQDDKLITASGPEAAKEFGEKILHALKD